MKNKKSKDKKPKTKIPFPPQRGASFRPPTKQSQYAKKLIGVRAGR